VRVLAMALLLANLLFLAWHFWIKSEPTPATDSYRGVARLELAERSAPASGVAGEIQPQEVEQPTGGVDGEPGEQGVGIQPASNETGAEAAEPEMTSPVLSCVSLGPFPEREDATAVLAKLLDKGYEATQRTTEGEIWQGYWVYLPPFPNRDAARGALTMLGGKGITDAYIIPGGEDKNAISLGLYSEKERAERRMSDVEAKGIEPRLAESKRVGTVYWLDVQVPDAQSIDPLEYRSSTDKILRLHADPCEEDRPPARSED